MRPCGMFVACADMLQSSVECSVASHSREPTYLPSHRGASFGRFSSSTLLRRMLDQERGLLRCIGSSLSFLHWTATSISKLECPQPFGLKRFHLAQVSTTQFCSSPPAFMARVDDASDRPVPLSPVPTRLQILVVLTVPALISMGWALNR